EFKALLKNNGFRLSAIGSPIGKTRIDHDFSLQLKRFERAIHLCKVFDTPNIRIFSYYPPGDCHDWNVVDETWEKEVFDRMQRKIKLAEDNNLTLMHENEHRIYGDSPDRVNRLMNQVNSPRFRAVYDAANYVFCGYDPWEGWIKSREYTAHFHIKDWKSGESHGCLPGEGDGRWFEVLKDAIARNYQGFATMEPHLLGGGPTGGLTGPDLFPKAVHFFEVLLKEAGGKRD
ncbi:MAG: sugar phosphate isomerase/epimerase family protein, partial [Gemmataceae bacterium]